MCNKHDSYCSNCNQWIPNNIVHACRGTSDNYYYYNGCGQYISGSHICPGTGNFGYYQQPTDYYKCPKCKGEFSKPFNKFTGGYKEVDIKEFPNNQIVGKTQEPIYICVCPFCNLEMIGFNQ